MCRRGTLRNESDLLYAVEDFNLASDLLNEKMHNHRLTIAILGSLKCSFRRTAKIIRVE